jgi:hypothetical protein
MNPTKDWMDETCKLLKQGGNLQEIKIEVKLDHLDTVNPSDLAKFTPLLQPLGQFERVEVSDCEGAANGGLWSKIEDDNGG